MRRQERSAGGKSCLTHPPPPNSYPVKTSSRHKADIKTSSQAKRSVPGEDLGCRGEAAGGSGLHRGEELAGAEAGGASPGAGHVGFAAHLRIIYQETPRERRDTCEAADPITPKPPSPEGKREDPARTGPEQPGPWRRDRGRCWGSAQTWPGSESNVPCAGAQFVWVRASGASRLQLGPRESEERLANRGKGRWGKCTQVLAPGGFG